MKVLCTSCQEEILKADINISSDIAYCQKCSNIFKLSDLLKSFATNNIKLVDPYQSDNLKYEEKNIVKEVNPYQSDNLEYEEKKINLEKNVNTISNVYKLETYKKSGKANFNLNDPPKDTWYKEFDNGFEIGASTRSRIAFVLIPFMMAWSGGSLSGLYISQFTEGKFDLFKSLFGLPFLAGSIILFTATMMMAFGKVYIRVQDNEGVIFTGVGSTGVQKFFKLDEISTVREDILNNKGTNSGRIVLEGQKRYSFGSILNSEKRHFITNALKQIIKK